MRVTISDKMYLPYVRQRLVEFRGEACLLAVMIDITERKQIETEQEQSSQLLRLITENVGDLITLHHPESSYQYVSPSSKRMLGYDPDEMMALDPLSLVHPVDVEQVRERWQGIGNGTEKSKPFTYRIRNHDGDLHMV